MFCFCHLPPVLYLILFFHCFISSYILDLYFYITAALNLSVQKNTEADKLRTTNYRPRPAQINYQRIYVPL